MHTAAASLLQGTLFGHITQLQQTHPTIQCLVGPYTGSLTPQHHGAAKHERLHVQVQASGSVSQLEARVARVQQSLLQAKDVLQLTSRLSSSSG